MYIHTIYWGIRMFTWEFSFMQEIYVHTVGISFDSSF